MMVSVRVERVTFEPTSKRFIVFLRDDIYHRRLPIVVGPAEAQAIEIQLENIDPPRPMTHDLIKILLDTVDANINRVIVTDLKDNTFYATIDLKKNGSQCDVDARPSDAIALALRTQAPIFVEEAVMKKASIGDDLTNFKPPQVQDDLQTLKYQLQQAIEDERYEDAAHLRDKIKDFQELEKKKKKKK